MPSICDRLSKPYPCGIMAAEVHGTPDRRDQRQIREDRRRRVPELRRQYRAHCQILPGVRRKAVSCPARVNGNP